MSVQRIGGISSADWGIISRLGISSVHWGISSVHWGMSSCIGGCHQCTGDIMSTLGECHDLYGRYHDLCGGYHQCIKVFHNNNVILPPPPPPPPNLLNTLQCTGDLKLKSLQAVHMELRLGNSPFNGTDCVKTSEVKK